tara:strand:- start:107 stop:430 length:324 start_codon:yes stop_codon:yes gene_type:complete
MRNLGGMMKKVQEMQSQMEAMQVEMSTRQFSATSGGGAVSVTITGKGRIISVSITEDIVNPKDIETLEDLIQLAVNNAKDEVDKALSLEMNKLTGGLPLPPGIKFPI